MLVPKAEELVANPTATAARDGGEVLRDRLRARLRPRPRVGQPDYPITVFYAFKQTELDKEGVASTGWSTFLEGMIREGWTITATWPVRSELGNRMRAIGSNALASSIVLALRPRPETAAATTAGFLAALRVELEIALPRSGRAPSPPPTSARPSSAQAWPSTLATLGSWSRTAPACQSRPHWPSSTALSTRSRPSRTATSTPTPGSAWTGTSRTAGPPAHTATPSRSPCPWACPWKASPAAASSPRAAARSRLIRPRTSTLAWNPSRDDRISLWEATCHLARAYATRGARSCRQAHGRDPDHRSADISLEDIQRLALRLYELMETKDAPPPACSTASAEPGPNSRRLAHHPAAPFRAASTSTPCAIPRRTTDDHPDEQREGTARPRPPAVGYRAMGGHAHGVPRSRPARTGSSWSAAEDATKFGTAKTYSREDVRFLLRIVTETMAGVQERPVAPQSALASELRETAQRGAPRREVLPRRHLPGPGHDRTAADGDRRRDQADAVAKLRMEHQREVFEKQTRNGAAKADAQRWPSPARWPGRPSSRGARSSRRTRTCSAAGSPAGRVRRRPVGRSPSAQRRRRVHGPGRVLPPHLPDREPEGAAASARCGGSPGTGGDPVVQLQTNFGGGKTHSMLALYHLFSGSATARLPRSVQDRASTACR